MISDRAVRKALLASGAGGIVVAVTFAVWLISSAGSRHRNADAILADLAVIDGFRIVEPRLNGDLPHAPFRFSRESPRLASLRAQPRLFSEVVTQSMKQRPALTRLLLGEP